MQMTSINIPKPVIIKDIEINSPNIRTFKLLNYLDGQKFKNVIPGKFCNLWIPNHDMKPFSISGFNDDALFITVKKVGKTTTVMHEKLKIGDKIGLMGPLGNGFTIKGKNVLLIGGGFGLAPLRYLLTELTKMKINVTSLLGFKTESDIFFVEEFKKHSKKSFMTTEDGCMGEMGYCTDLLGKIKKDYIIEQIYCCGPELMMYEVLQFAIANKIDAQFSLERYFGCGIGICGTCHLDGKFRVCIDGPVIDLLKLKDLSDFGRFKLTRTGTKVKI